MRHAPPAAGEVAQANNPLANFTAFNLHNYYIGEYTETGGKSGNQFWMRYARPFGFWQLGGGTYLRSTGVMVWNLDKHTCSVPVGLGIGQVIPTQSAVLNLFAEPQVSVADKGALWPV